MVFGHLLTSKRLSIDTSWKVLVHISGTITPNSHSDSTGKRVNKGVYMFPTVERHMGGYSPVCWFKRNDPRRLRPTRQWAGFAPKAQHHAFRVCLRGLNHPGAGGQIPIWESPVGVFVPVRGRRCLDVLYLVLSNRVLPLKTVIRVGAFCCYNSFAYSTRRGCLSRFPAFRGRGDVFEVVTETF